MTVKYKEKYTAIPLAILFLFLISSKIKEDFPPWDPARRWFMIADAVLYFAIFVYFLYDLMQMRRYYQNEGVQAPLKTQRRQLVGYVAVMLLCAFVVIVQLAEFFGYKLLPFWG